MTQDLNNEITKLERKLENIKIALKDIYIDKTNNLISENDFIELKMQLEEDRKEYESKISQTKKKIKSNQESVKNSSIIENKIKEFLSLKHPDKQILVDLIQKIEIMKDKQVKIFLNFNLE